MCSDRTNSYKSTALITLAIFVAGCTFAGLTVAASTVAAQDDQTSLGDAARKVRTEKKNEPASKTFTNENLPKTDAGISVVGQAPAAAAAPAASPAPAAAAASDDKSADKSSTNPASPAPATAPVSVAQMAVQHELDAALIQKDQLEKELDLSQRDYSLQEQQALQNPKFNFDRDAQAHLTELHQGIDDQKAELEKVKTHIADLQKKLEDMNKGSEPGSK
jgi:ATP-dependent Lon protease